MCLRHKQLINIQIMREVIQTGKTIEEALEKAVAELNVDVDDVEYEVLEAATTGFLGFGSKPAKIVARCDVRKSDEIISKPSERPKRFEKPAPPRPERPASPRPERAAHPRPEKADTQESKPPRPASFYEKNDEDFVPTENAIPFIEGFLKDLFEKASFNVQANVVRNGRFIEVNLIGEDVGSVIGKHGDTLDAFQHITQLAFNKALSGGEKIRIDTENYREKREKTLVGLAKSIANRVIKSKGKYELEPMKAYERRIIHSTLQSYPMLTTYSVGNEPQRRIVIAFKNR